MDFESLIENGGNFTGFNDFSVQIVKGIKKDEFLPGF